MIEQPYPSGRRITIGTANFHYVRRPACDRAGRQHLAVPRVNRHLIVAMNRVNPVQQVHYILSSLPGNPAALRSR